MSKKAGHSGKEHCHQPPQHQHHSGLLERRGRPPFFLQLRGPPLSALTLLRAGVGIVQRHGNPYPLRETVWDSGRNSQERRRKPGFWLGFATHWLCDAGQIICTLGSSFLSCERGGPNKLSLKVLFMSTILRLSNVPETMWNSSRGLEIRVSCSLRMSLQKNLSSEPPVYPSVSHSDLFCARSPGVPPFQASHTSLGGLPPNKQHCYHMAWPFLCNTWGY